MDADTASLDAPKIALVATLGSVTPALPFVFRNYELPIATSPLFEEVRVLLFREVIRGQKTLLLYFFYSVILNYINYINVCLISPTSADSRERGQLSAPRVAGGAGVFSGDLLSGRVHLRGGQVPGRRGDRKQPGSDCASRSTAALARLSN